MKGKCHVVHITKEDFDVTTAAGLQNSLDIAHARPGALLWTFLPCTRDVLGGKASPGALSHSRTLAACGPGREGVRRVDCLGVEEGLPALEPSRRAGGFVGIRPTRFW